MHLQEFNTLPLSERAASVWKRGTFLSTRTEGNYGLALYHMGRFFCEMWYDPAFNEIVLVQGFTSQWLPEPYLDTIELPQF
ncbi:hypothetical protein DXT99_23170 [Pontibacter diazotrophicus]|uniref:Uncharacterized protein n=1 Tax=Pontibacter diazotrophicus TaxID=1400979 RepID=A0A3D8L3E1_9BACT|nr:hypothetical protein [Pontibacter diazotrophicus]RDV11928.1 hypothetical protein DXT99_23170 [Pontibacter diazotrophicus]